MLRKQLSQATQVHLDVGDSVMKRAPDRSCKLTPKFSGPFLLTAKLHGNKFKILGPNTNVSEAVHVDRLKKVSASFTPAAVPSPPSPTDLPSPPVAHPFHSYRLRSAERNWSVPPPLFPCKEWGQVSSSFLYFSCVFFIFGLPPLGTYPFLGAYAFIFLCIKRGFVFCAFFHLPYTFYFLSFLI